MRKNRLLFSLIWLILLAIFNLCVFLLRPMIPGLESGFDTRFWIAWAFIIAAFVGNLFCTLFAFRSETQNKMFFKLPLITVSWAALAAMALLGCGLILTPGCSARVAAVACILVLAAHAIAVIQGTWAASAAEKVEDKVKVQASFMRELTAKADGILARAKSDAVKAECKKVYEALRYSDPLSNESLAEIEETIVGSMDKLSSAVETNNAEKAKQIADEIILLASEQNRKCKESK